MTLVVAQKPTSTRLLPQTALEWLGSFRLPAAQSFSDNELMRSTNYSYMGRGICYNPVNDSLFVSGHDWYQRIGEVTIPAVVKSTTISSLKRSAVIQPLNSYMNRIPVFETDTNGIKTGDMLIVNGRLVVSLYQYYDGNADAKKSHIIFDSLDLNSPIHGEFGPTGILAGYVAGYMCLVPVEWRERLGTTCVTGQCGLAITTRTSAGPALVGFDPLKFNDPAVPFPVTPYVSYPFLHGGSSPDDHPLQSPMSGNNNIYNLSSNVTGVLFPDGTDSVWFIGSRGIGNLGYGEGVNQISLDGKKSPGGTYNYDPCNNYKGYHAYPYSPIVWAYDANDFLAAKNGTKKPWEVKPYDVWPFDLLIKGCAGNVGGVAFDPVSRRVFITALAVASGGEAIIHVFKV